LLGDQDTGEATDDLHRKRTQLSSTAPGPVSACCTRHGSLPGVRPVWPRLR
jgi:hypothetical protein